MDRLVRFARTLGGLMLAGKFRTVNEGRGVRGGLGNGSGSMRAAAVRTARMLGCRSLSMVVIGAAPAERLSRPRLVRRAVGAAGVGREFFRYRVAYQVCQRDKVPRGARVRGIEGPRGDRFHVFGRAFGAFGGAGKAREGDHDPAWCGRPC